MLRKELCTGIVEHNLVRCTMVESAIQHEVPVERITPSVSHRRDH
jgi:hypothetical protein